jgi:protein-L-isoaspartate(D-aspartate) O-methyltransferase
MGSACLGKGNPPIRLSENAVTANDDPLAKGARPRRETMEDFADARKKMVDSQLRTENVTDHAVLAAMGAVPREAFVPPNLRSLAYLDRGILLKDAADGAPARFLMPPAPLARLIQLADVGPADRVLVVGSGTGYAAAVLARLVDSVLALESDPALSAQAQRTLSELGLANVEPVVGPLEAGYPSGGPYDAILVDGAVEVLPPGLLDQLKDGGRLVAIVGYGRTGTATLFAFSGGKVGRLPAFDASVPPLPGFRKPEVFVF